MSRHLINRSAAVLMAAALLVGAVAPVSATVWTDQADYSPGSVVTISGDNSNGAGYVPGETVHVDVSGPNGYASSCDAVADESGAWSCQVTLWSSELAVGEYDYTATGQTSGVTESGSFTDKTEVTITSAAFVWYTSTSFDVLVEGTYTCDLVGAAAGDCNDADDVTITIHESDASNNNATGAVGDRTKVLAVSSAGGTFNWSFTFEFRPPVPGAGQFNTPSDGHFDVQAIFHGTLSGVARTSDPTVRDNYFGVDDTLPTSTIDTVVASTMPSADGTATDPGSTSPVEHFSGFDNGDSPDPVHVEIRTDPGNVLVAGSGQDLTLAGLGSTKQSGTWEYDYAGTPLTEGADYCIVGQATDHAGNVQNPVTTSCFTVDSAPTVTSTTPTNGATGVAANADIDITFSESVGAASGWFDITCGSSGNHTAVESGGSTTFTLDPGTDFTAGETCTVTVYASMITDSDTDDPPDNMAANYVFSFTVAGGGGGPVTPTLTTEVRDASDDSPGTSFPSGTTVYDHASVDSGSEGTVDFALYSGSDCTDQLGSPEGSDTLVGLVSGEADSMDFGPLSSGSYYFLVDYNSSDTDQWLDTSTCEEFTIEAPPDALSALSAFHGWIGLKNSDDQGTQFDLKVELFDGDSLVASGLQRCITGVTRNPSFAKEAIVTWDSFTPYDLSSASTLSFNVSTRIGTNTNGTKCSGPGGSHNNAVGLRLYYDSTARQSRFDATIGSGSSTDWYLRSDGNACVNAQSTGVTTRYLSMTAPTATSAKCKDSTGVNFAGGNPWKEIGSWVWTLP
jgi:hypothetical protein